MNPYVKYGLKVFLDYLIMIFVFLVFLLPGLVHIGLYSIVMLLLGYSLFYSDFKTLAVKDARPRHDGSLRPARFMGLIYGIIGVLPVVLGWILYQMTLFANASDEKTKNIILKFFLGPVFGFTTPYLVLILGIAVMTGLGYLAGYYHFNLFTHFSKKPQTKGRPVQKARR